MNQLNIFIHLILTLLIAETMPFPQRLNSVASRMKDRCPPLAHVALRRVIALDIALIGAAINGHRVPNCQKRLDRDVLQKKPFCLPSPWLVSPTIG